jgi:hypothetical protein
MGCGQEREEVAAPTPTPSPSTPPDDADEDDDGDEPPDTFVSVACTGVNCGALDGGTYSGSGVGIWSRVNASGSSSSSGTLRITGAAGKTATFIFTNRGSSSRAFDPFPSLLASGPDVSARPAPPSPRRLTRTAPRVRHLEPERRRRPAEFRRGPSGSVRRNVAPRADVGDTRNFYSEDDSLRSTTLRAKRTTGDGRTVNFWVQNGEFGAGKVTQAILDSLADSFASGSDSVYSMVTGIAGQPWGTHPYSNLIPASQELDIVMLDFDNNNQPWGLVGFFWSRNNFLASQVAKSNESLSFYLDTETAYLAGSSGLKYELSTLAHEFTHMINFYQREVLIGDSYAYDTWLEEMTAMQMEDITSLKIDPTFNSIRDDRFLSWVNGGDFNCPLDEWDDDTNSPCFGYNVAGSMGGFLLRQLGISFYEGLLANASSTSSVTLLDDAIRDAGGAGLSDALTKWGASIALLPAASSPPGYGYPELVDQGFTIPAIDGPSFALDRNLPQDTPTTLSKRSHYVEERSSLSDPFEETVNVPAGSSLLLIIQ